MTKLIDIKTAHDLHDSAHQGKLLPGSELASPCIGTLPYTAEKTNALGGKRAVGSGKIGSIII